MSTGTNQHAYDSVGQSRDSYKAFPWVRPIPIAIVMQVIEPMKPSSRPKSLPPRHSLGTSEEVWPAGGPGHCQLDLHQTPLPLGPPDPTLPLDDNDERHSASSRVCLNLTLSLRPRREWGCFPLLQTHPGKCRGSRGPPEFSTLTPAVGLRTLTPRKTLLPSFGAGPSTDLEACSPEVAWFSIMGTGTTVCV